LLINLFGISEDRAMKKNLEAIHKNRKIEAGKR